MLFLKLGGNEILYGDEGFALKVFHKVLLAYILWKGDEEFPPKTGVLFDSTIQSHLPLDIIWCKVAETSRRLAELSLPKRKLGVKSDSSHSQIVISRRVKKAKPTSLKDYVTTELNDYETTQLKSPNY